MPIWGWFCVGGVTILVAVVAIALIRLDREMRQEEQRLTDHGEDVVAAILMANNALYAGRSRFSLPGGYSYAQVIFTIEGRRTEAHLARLQEYGERLRSFTPVTGAGRDESVIASVMRTEVPYTKPLKIPERLTEGAEVYNASVQVPWAMLPEGRLTLPYIYCRVLLGEGGGIKMIEYPAKKRAKPKTDRP